MKKTLTQLNNHILQLQKAEATHFGNYSEQSFQYFDKLSFIEFDGLYDITWFSGDYGYTSYSLDDLAPFDPDNLEQYKEGDDYEGNGLSWLIDTLSRKRNLIRSLTFLSNDVGANGTREWCFDRLLEYNLTFPNLQSFKVQLTELGDHNTSIIGNIDANSNKAVTQLLSLMPNIYEVELPGVPDQDFFKLEFPNLRYMKVQAGYDSGHFIKHLANSKLLSQIGLDFMDNLFDEEFKYKTSEEKHFEEQMKQRETAIKNADDPEKAQKELHRQALKEAGFSKEEISLDLDNPTREETLRLLTIIYKGNKKEIQEEMDYYESNNAWDQNGNPIVDNDDDTENLYEFYESDTINKRTSFDDYKALLSSPYIKDRWHFKLREGYLTKEQLFKLQELNDIQFLHIPTTLDYYISHRYRDENTNK